MISWYYCSLCTAATSRLTTSRFFSGYNHVFAGLSRSDFVDKIENQAVFIKTHYAPRVASLDKGKLSLALDFQPHFVGNAMMPAQHGGVALAMMEHTGEYCAQSVLLDAQHEITTQNIRVDYLEPAPCNETVYFDAFVVHKSKKLIRVDVELWNEQRLTKVAIGRCLFSCLPRGGDHDHKREEKVVGSGTSAAL